MNIAVIFDQKLFSGGGYQQSLNALKLINKLSKNKLNFIFYTTIFKNKIFLKNKKIKLNYLRFSVILRIVSQIKLNPKFHLIKIILDLLIPISFLELELSSQNIDLVYFVSPSNLATDLREINFVFTVWDLCHLDHPEFPEIRKNNQFEIREKLYKSVLNKAFSIIVDCNATKNTISSKYYIDKKRIAIIPFEPNPNLDENIGRYFENISLEKKINSFSNFLLYPAQYWPHKNHIYIMQAMKILLVDNRFNIAVIFTGSNKGNLKYLKNFARENKIQKNIIFLDFVSDNDLSRLYKRCLLL